VVTRIIALLLSILLSVSFAEAGEPPPGIRPDVVSVCTLLRAPDRYPKALVEVHGAILTNGIDSVAIGDPRCKKLGVIRIGKAELGADQESLQKLFDTAQLAYVSSNNAFRVMVQVTLVGTFYPSRSGIHPELRPKEVQSMRLVKWVSLVPSIPSRRRYP
jgi:hypothetical protein